MADELGLGADRPALWWLAVAFLLGVATGAGGLVAARRAPAAAIMITPAAVPTVAPTATASPIEVYVNGQVMRPGRYRLAAGSRVEEGIEIAGGLTPAAAVDWVNLAQPLVDGMQIYVPAEGETAGAWPVTGVTDPAVATSVPGRVNVNEADQALLETLPRIGPSTAQKIIDYRDANGPFTSVDALLDVPGIGEATLAGLKDLITIGE